MHKLNPHYLEEAISPKTRVIMLAHALGNPFNLDAVLDDFCQHSYGPAAAAMRAAHSFTRAPSASFSNFHSCLS